MGTETKSPWRLAFTAALLGSVCFGHSAAWAQPAGSNAPGDAASERVLLDQARFWSQEGRIDLATQALERLLEGDPQHLQGLYELGVIHLRRGDLPAARASLQRLQRLPGAESLVTELKADIESASLDIRQIEEARRLATVGDYPGSVRLYERLFEGRDVPNQFAVEYYLTMAGLPDRWIEARRALQDLAREFPQSTEYSLGVARVLSYREDTRRESLRQLKALSEQHSARRDALDAMRDALLWLGARPEDVNLFETYLEARPDDIQVSARLDAIRNPQGETLVTMLRQEGYDHLDAADLDAAEQSFSAALAENAQDAQSLAGLGIVRGRQERFSEAAELLREAIRRDPANRVDFSKALDSVSFWADMQDARRAKSFGEFGAARRTLDSIVPRTEDERAELAILRGELAMDLEAWAEARQHYAEALEIAPDNASAYIGIVSAYMRGSDTEQVEGFLDSGASRDAERFGSGPARSAAAKARGWIADRRGDVIAASSWYALAIELDPSDPWVRLEAARLHSAAGRDLEAESLFSGAGLSEDPAFVHAAALFHAGEGRWGRALNLLEGVPADLRTPAIATLIKRAELREEVARIMLSHTGVARGQSRQGLLALYSPFETHPDDAQLLASVLVEIGSGDAAIALLRQSIEARGDDEVSALANSASMLVTIGDLAGAQAVLDRLRVKARAMTTADRQLVARVYDDYLVALARETMASGDFGRANDYVDAVLGSNPVHSPALRTVAEIRVRAGDFDGGLEGYRFALDVDPADRDALRGAVGAAIQAGRLRVAADLLDSALMLSPDDPGLYQLVADVAKAAGDIRTAIDATEKARMLEAELGLQPSNPLDGAFASSGPPRVSNPFRNGQTSQIQGAPLTEDGLTSSWGLGPDAAGRGPVPRLGGDAVQDPALDGVQPIAFMVRQDAMTGAVRPSVFLQDPPRPRPTRYQVGEPQDLQSPTGSRDLSADSFRRRLRSVDDSRPTSAAARAPRAAAAADYSDYDWELAELQAQKFPTSGSNLGFRFRSGDEGLSQVTEFNAPAILTVPAGGRLSVGATPVFLTSGELGDDPLTTRFFGFLGLVEAAEREAPDDISDAGGVAFSGAYQIGGLKADVGLTPLGFEFVNAVGGVSFSHTFENGFGFTASGSRRAKIDSVLSYAGLEDPVTGEVFGAAVDNRASLGLSIASPVSLIYATGAISVVDGENLETNTGYQLDAGGLFEVLRQDEQSVRTGVALTYLGYEDNRRFFTFGHGGYFSPQTFITAQIPVRYGRDDGRIRVDAGASFGIQFFSEDEEDFFPDRPDLNAALLEVAIEDAVEFDLAEIPDLTYDATSETNLALSADMDFEYRVTPYLSFAAQGRLDRTADFEEVAARFGIKYNFGVR